MIGNIQQGSGFGGLLRYLHFGEKDRAAGDGPPRVDWTDLHHLAPCDDPNQLAAIMRVTAQTYSRPPKEPVLHISISWAPEDEPTPDQMRRIATQVLDRMGLAQHQAVVLAHRDTDHRHLHIVANRVREDGQELWDAWKSKKRLEGILRDLEREHGFTVVPGRLVPVGDRPAQSLVTRGEYLQALHKDTARTPGQQQHVRLELRQRFRTSNSWAELEARLAAVGLRLERRGRGLVVTDGERKLKASRIDRQSSKGKLEKRFGQTFESWLAEKRRLRAVTSKIVHHQNRRRHLERRFRDVTDPVALERLARIKQRVETTIQGLQGNLAAVYRPIQSRMLKKTAKEAVGLTGLRLPAQTPATRTALAGLNLVSRLLPPAAGKVLRLTIRTANHLGHERTL